MSDEKKTYKCEKCGAEVEKGIVLDVTLLVSFTERQGGWTKRAAIGQCPPCHEKTLSTITKALMIEDEKPQV